MLVIQRAGRLAGEKVDLPYHEAQAAVLAGRCDPLPGEEWRYETTALKPAEKAVVKQAETAMVTSPEKRYTCPHCRVSSAKKGIMMRWHFDNCKHGQS